MLHKVAFVRPASVELEDSNVANTSAVGRNSLTGEEAQAFYEDIVGVPSGPKPDLDLPASRICYTMYDSSDDEGVNMPKERSELAKAVFSCAQSGADRELRRLILLKRIDANIQDASGWTPLHYAAFGGHLDCVRILLTFGAKKELIDNNGRTALEMARQSGNNSAYNLIKFYGDHEQRECGLYSARPDVVPLQSCKAEFDAPDMRSTLPLSLDAVGSQLGTKSTYGISEGNKGFRMLESMGWEKQTGLGPDGKGRRFPIKTNLKSDRQGLGLPSKERKEIRSNEKDGRALKSRGEIKPKMRTQRKTAREKILEIEFRRAFY